MKARNEHYLEFQKRFTASLDQIMSHYDAERETENKFAQYWSDNLKQITAKHI